LPFATRGALLESRRQFLKLLATAATAAVVPVPLRALAASRPPLDVFFPQDPLATWFEPTFGAVKPDGRRHLGIDLMAPKLSPVFSIADGTVQRISQSPRAGRHLILDHADGWQSWYLHLNNDAAGRDNGRADWALSVVEGIEEGTEVRAGQHIGYVGDSGNAEGAQPHTHFELHLRSRILNPYPYLVESHAVAAAIAHDHLVEVNIDTVCFPGPRSPAADGVVCPPPPQDFEAIPLGISGAY
jgi:murein DD-endopeptidase MepM/ murein hydrolase activator NlpD